jgi:hypothetical protein
LRYVADLFTSPKETASTKESAEIPGADALLAEGVRASRTESKAIAVSKESSSSKEVAVAKVTG